MPSPYTLPTVRAALCLSTVGSLLLAGCSDSAVAPTAAPEHHFTAQEAADSALAIRSHTQQAVTAEVARAVALALHDQGLREKIKNDLRASRATREHKLEFRSYLHGNGGILAAKMGQALGKSPADVIAMVETVRPLEFYMPVPQHRAAWTGGENLIVAAQVTEREVPAGFALDGTPVALSKDAPPATPTLTIVSQETNFATATVPETLKNGDDQDGKAIGTYGRTGGGTAQPSGGPSRMVACDPADGCGGGGGYATYPPGLYLEFSHIDDLNESWPRGAPEIEAHLIGPTAFGGDGEHLSCSGAGTTGLYGFNQNDHDWSLSPYTAEGMLFSQDQIARFEQVYNTGYAIQFWEDDDEACVIKTSNRSQLEELYSKLQQAYQVTSLIVQIVGTRDWRIVPRAVTAIIGLTQGDDDFVGVAVKQDMVGYNYPDATHVLALNANGSPLQINGRIRLVTKYP